MMDLDFTGKVKLSNKVSSYMPYRSLMPMAMEARKPIFNLKAADGAIGSHTKSVQDCQDDFKALANQILKRYSF